MASNLSGLAQNLQNAVAGIGELLGINLGSKGDKGKYPGDSESGKANSGIGKVLNQIDPKNWNKSLPYTFAVIKDAGIVTVPVDEFGEFPLPINPSDLNQDETFAIKIQPTQGGTIVQHGGNKYGNLVISGTTGISPKRGAGGVSKITGRAFGQPDQLEFKSGYEVFLRLRNWFKAYYQFKSLRSNNNAKTGRLVFKNYKDGEFLIIELESFSMKRSSSRKTLYDYVITCKILGRAGFSPQADDRGIFGKIDDTLNAAFDKIDNARGVFLNSQNLLRQIESNYEATIVEPMRKTGLALKAFLGIGKVAADMGNKAIKSTVSAAAAFAIILGLKNQQAQAKKSADVDSRITSAALPGLQGNSIVNAQSLVTLGQQSDVLMAVDASEFPETTQAALDAEETAATELPRSYFEDALADLIRVRDNAADFFNLGDASYDALSERVATNKADESKLVTDKEFALLAAFSDAIEGMNLLLSTNALFKSSYAARIQTAKDTFDEGELDDLRAEQAVKEIVMPADTDLERLALNQLGDQTRWVEIAELNSLKPPYVVQDLSDSTTNVVRPGDKILIPQPIIDGFGNTPTVKERFLNQDLNALERNLGIDFKVSKDGDLVLTNRGDLDIVKGVENAAQAIILKLGYEKGELLEHPDLGIGLTPGTKGSPVNEIKTQLIGTLTADPRFDAITNLDIKREGPQIVIRFLVLLKHVDTPVPIELKV